MARWGARSDTVRRHFVGLEQSLAFQTRIVTSTSISAVKRFIRCRYGDLPLARATWHHLAFFGIRRRRCGGAATPTFTAPEARSGGMYSETSRARTVEPLYKRSESTPWSVPAVDSHLRPRPKTHGRAIELEGGGGARRGAISVH